MLAASQSKFIFAAVLAAFPCVVAAQPSEVDRLRSQVAALAAENARMQQEIAELGNRLDALSRPQPAALSAKPAAPVTQAVVPTSQLSGMQSAAEGPATLLGSHFRLYGQLRLDTDIDTYRPNSTETPLFISTPDPSGPGKFSDYAVHPRLSRFGLDFTAPPSEGLAGGQLSGKIETDFENGGTESRQIIRIRHAYLKASWKDFSILGGQTWDVFSPLFPTVNNDTLMWNAGNVGDRRPQLRATYEPTAIGVKWSFATAVGLTGAIDGLDLDGNGFLDGQQARVPNLQARIGGSRVLWVNHQPFSLGLSEFYSQSSTTRAIGGQTQLNAQGMNMDYTLPLVSELTWRGEIWCGRNMSDMRGGIGQGFNSVLGRVIRSRGGWSEVAWRLTRRWTVAPGFTVDDPMARDLSKGNRSRNMAAYLANRFAVDQALTVGLDYLRWRTDYVGGPYAIDNRINIFFQYGF